MTEAELLRLAASKLARLERDERFNDAASAHALAALMASQCYLLNAVAAILDKIEQSQPARP